MLVSLPQWPDFSSFGSFFPKLVTRLEFDLPYSKFGYALFGVGRGAVAMEQCVSEVSSAHFKTNRGPVMSIRSMRACKEGKYHSLVEGKYLGILL